MENESLVKQVKAAISLPKVNGFVHGRVTQLVNEGADLETAVLPFIAQRNPDKLNTDRVYVSGVEFRRSFGDRYFVQIPVAKIPEVIESEEFQWFNFSHAVRNAYE